MIKLILFDCDGPIIKREKYFSQRLEQETGVAVDTKNEASFFRGDFLSCETGKADLKEILPKWLPVWKWQGTVNELLKYWFEGEAFVDPKMKDYILALRENGVKCFLSTNNEKYRTEYLWHTVGLKNFLDGLYSSCYLGFMKPNLDFWQEVYKTLPNVAKNEVFVIDDKMLAVESARAFGFNAELYKGFEDFKQMVLKYNS